MTPILQCNNLTKRYGSVAALDEMNLSLAPGKIVGLLGPNGSGKTTLLKLICRLLTPTSGELLVDGKQPGIETKALVSYLPDATYLDSAMSVEGCIRMFTDFYKDFEPQRARDMLDLLHIAPSQGIRTLSKGNREKVQLILVMSRNAKLYLLDEPIAGVDPAARDYILHTIVSNYRPESTVLLSTHLIRDVEAVLDDAVFLSRGKVLLYQPVDMIREQQGKTVDEYFREVFKCLESC